MKLVSLGCLIFSALLLGCASDTRRDKFERDEWQQYVNRFMEQDYAANPSFAAHMGRHEYDGVIADISPAAIASDVDRLTRAQKEVAEFPNYKLSEPQKFERKYLLAGIEAELFWLSKSERPFTSPNFYSGRVDPSMFITEEYAPPKQRMKGFIKLAKAIPKACSEIKAIIRPNIPKPVLEQSILVYKGLASYVRDDVPQAFASVDDPALQKELHDSAVQASQNFMDLVAWLEGQRATASPKFAWGTEKLQAYLSATEQVKMSIADVEKAGQADLEHNLKDLKTVCAKFAPHKSLKACVTKEESVKPKEDMLTVAAKQLTELKSFIKAHDIVTIPSPQDALVEASPPYMRWNTASLRSPGYYDKTLPSIYYISPPDPKWSTSMQKAYLKPEAHLLGISAHEVWPGHFLDKLHRNLLPPLFSVYGSYAASEGWAHYCEEMMLEEGLRSDQPAVKISQLLEALLRDVRLLSSIGMHTEKMTQAQSEKLFIQKAFADPGTAKQQAARGTFDPGYFNYTLGKLMIRKLRDDWAETRGGKSAWKQFHDQYLSYGDAPVPLTREVMMGRKDSVL